MKHEDITLECSDGYPLAANLYRAPGATAAVVIAPALGVPRRFYASYAGFLAKNGISALVFDYRGSGDSARGPVRGRDISMEDWGRLDIDAALTWALQNLDPDSLYLVGHSAGAQLVGLAPSSTRLDGLILVAGSAPHLRHYPLKSWPLLFTTWYLLAPLLGMGRDDFPTRQTGLGTTRVASGVVRQWARWARTPDYMFDTAHDLNGSCYSQLDLRILSYCFADDSYATPAAVDALLGHYSAARINRQVVPKPARGQIGHFGFFRQQSAAGLWEESLRWVRAAT